MPILTTQEKVAIVENYFQPIDAKLFQIAHELWLHVLKEIQVKGHLLTLIWLCEKLHVEKLGYMVKFQEVFQSSSAVSSTSLFPKVLSSCVMNEIRHEEVVE